MQATACAEDACLANITRVYVSPLQRTMETCLLIFGGKPNVEIIVTPELRELNYLQTSDAPLPPRHIGHSVEWLKAKFPQPNIVWDAIMLTDEWWEPHGDLSDCLQRIQGFLKTLVGESQQQLQQQQQQQIPSSETHSRRMSASVASPNGPKSKGTVLDDDVEQEVLREDKEEERVERQTPKTPHPTLRELPSIAIVAHENVLRLMFGVSMVSHCEPLLATLTYTSLPVRPEDRFVVAVPAISRWQQVAAKMDFIVVLGCADSDIQARRVFHGLDIALNHNLPVIMACAVAEYPTFRNSLKDFSTTQRPLSSRDHSTIICDMNSKVTESNAIFSLAVIECHLRCLGILPSEPLKDGPLSSCTFRIVTNDWHMPRALMAFRNVSDTLNSGAVIAGASVPTTIIDMKAYTYRHLGEGAILSTRITRYLDLWEEVRVECRKDLYVVAHLMRHWSYPRIQNGRQETRDLLRELIIKGGDSQRQEISNLILRAFQSDQPLALQPLKAPSASTAIHYAAEAGAINVVADLIFFWGADPSLQNAKGMTAIDFAKREGHFNVADFLAACLQ